MEWGMDELLRTHYWRGTATSGRMIPPTGPSKDAKSDAESINHDFLRLLPSRERLRFRAAEGLQQNSCPA